MFNTKIEKKNDKNLFKMTQQQKTYKIGKIIFKFLIFVENINNVIANFLFGEISLVFMEIYNKTNKKNNLNKNTYFLYRIFLRFPRK